MSNGLQSREGDCLTGPEVVDSLILIISGGVQPVAAVDRIETTNTIVRRTFGTCWRSSESPEEGSDCSRFGFFGHA